MGALPANSKPLPLPSTVIPAVLVRIRLRRWQDCHRLRRSRHRPRPSVRRWSGWYWRAPAQRRVSPGRCRRLAPGGIIGHVVGDEVAADDCRGGAVDQVDATTAPVAVTCKRRAAIVAGMTLLRMMGAAFHGDAAALVVIFSSVDRSCPCPRPTRDGEALDRGAGAGDADDLVRGPLRRASHLPDCIGAGEKSHMTRGGPMHDASHAPVQGDGFA